MIQLQVLLASLYLTLSVLQVKAAELPKIDPMIAIKPYLEQLANCESGGKTDIKILDTDGYYSYGKYQYHLATFRRLGIELGYFKENITNEELKTHIFKEWLQDEMTGRELILHPESWRLWTNCINKIGKYAN